MTFLDNDPEERYEPENPQELQQMIEALQQRVGKLEKVEARVADLEKYVRTVQNTREQRHPRSHAVTVYNMTADEYTTRYPHYCRRCNGIGGHKTDPGRIPTECPECFARGVCGRCAAQLPEYADTCPSCGWRAFNAADAMPGGNYV